MQKNIADAEKRLRAYVNSKFRFYPKTREILDVREELYSMMCDRYHDGVSSGEDEAESLREAKRIADNCRAAVREVETGSSLSALRRKLVEMLAFSAFYFMALTCVYLILSVFVFEEFARTWIVCVAGAFIYAVYVVMNFLGYAARFGLVRLRRIMLALLFFTFIPMFFVLPSIVSSVLLGRSIWGVSWLVVPFIVFLYVFTDLFAFGRGSSGWLFVIEAAVAGLLLASAIYLAVSQLFGWWSVSWIIFVIYFMVVALVFYLYEKTSPPERP